MSEDAVVINAGTSSIAPTACVIWLHGLGADGNDFAPIVPQLGLSQESGICFVFPHAPKQPVTINGGYVMPAWHDILQMEALHRDIDTTGLAQSCERIAAMAAAQATIVGWNKLVLAGFSQGGAVAVKLLEYLPQRPAGLLCLSTYAPGTINPAFAPDKLPALVMHGEHDPVVPLQLGESLAQQLRTIDLAVTYTTYPMAHQVCLEQIEAIGSWLGELLL